MSERVVYDTIYVSDGPSFQGTLDNGGTITVCGRSYPAFDGVRPMFLDQSGAYRPVNDVLVKQEDFEAIRDSFDANGLTETLERERELHPLS